MLLGELDPQAIGPAIEFATHYEPTPLADFNSLMKSVPPGFVFSDATFVDIGSGMGRVLMLASHFPFKQIVGIEISPALHEIARENISNFKGAGKKCRDIRLMRADAAECALPPGNLLVYLYNPFEGAHFEQFVQRLACEMHDDLVLVYHTPTQRNEVEKHAAFVLCAQTGCGVVYRKELAQKERGVDGLIARAHFEM
ncbi:MAG: hypothetical protein ABR584_01945 [Candidatus Baltobacteraceae bacterium]